MAKGRVVVQIPIDRNQNPGGEFKRGATAREGKRNEKKGYKIFYLYK